MWGWDFFLYINVEILHVACTRVHAEAGILRLFVEYFPWPVLHDDGRMEGRMDEKGRSNSAVRGIIIASVLGAVCSSTWSCKR